jgi:hypothetical protein
MTKFKINHFYRPPGKAAVVLLVQKIVSTGKDRTVLYGMWYELKGDTKKCLNVDQEVVVPRNEEHVWLLTL